MDLDLLRIEVGLSFCSCRRFLVQLDHLLGILIFVAVKVRLVKLYLILITVLGG